MFSAWLRIIYRKHTKLQTLISQGDSLSHDVQFQTSDIVTNITLAKISFYIILIVVNENLSKVLMKYSCTCTTTLITFSYRGGDFLKCLKLCSSIK